MSQIYSFDDFIIILADFKNPDEHKHLAYHIIVSLGGDMEWSIENENVVCKAVCMDSQVMHKGTVSGSGAIVIMFTGADRYSDYIKKRYLNGRQYITLDDEEAEKIAELYRKFNNDKNMLKKSLMHQFGLDESVQKKYDERISHVLSYIKNLDTIDNSIVDELVRITYLSKSRLSHLFKEQTGITLHSYLSFEKLRKTYFYIYEKNMSITDASILAGFYSPSHCATTCRRMFGLSLSEVFKNRNHSS